MLETVEIKILIGIDEVWGEERVDDTDVVRNGKMYNSVRNTKRIQHGMDNIHISYPLLNTIGNNLERSDKTLNIILLKALSRSEITTQYANDLMNINEDRYITR